MKLIEFTERERVFEYSTPKQLLIIFYSINLPFAKVKWEGSYKSAHVCARSLRRYVRDSALNGKITVAQRNDDVILIREDYESETCNTIDADKMKNLLPKG